MEPNTEATPTPFCFFLNPICSIWKEPLLKARYHYQNQEWQIEQGCHTRYIMKHLDQTDIRTYRLEDKLRNTS